MKKLISLFLACFFALSMVGNANASIPANCASFGYSVYTCARTSDGAWWTSTAKYGWFSASSELHIPACVFVPELSVPPLVIPAHYVVGARLEAASFYHPTYHMWYCGNDANHYSELWGHK